MSKQRLSVSVDSDLIEAGGASVARGHAKTLSAWVNEALRLKAEHDRRLDALAAFITTYEAKHGEITDAEMRLAARRASAGAVTSRALGTAKSVRRAGKPR